MTVPFRLAKNPYHLFNAVMSARFHKSQKQNALSIRERLPSGATKIDESKIVELLKYDYIDLHGENSSDAHIRAINEILSEQFRSTIDIMTLKGRKTVEGKNYHYPDSKDLDANSAFNVFRGVWQLFHPSVQYGHINDQPESSDLFIRSAIVVFYGFVPDRAKKEKERIDLLVIGRSTLWRGVAWIGPEKLYVHVNECLRDDVFEDQFFVFQLPGFHDYFRRSALSQMHGIVAGTVLDAAYNGNYPVVAAPCVARKLTTWTSWFEDHDRFIDRSFVSAIKSCFDLNYRTRGELIDLSKKLTSTPSDGSNDIREREFFSSLEALFGKICNPDGSVIHPLVRK